MCLVLNVSYIIAQIQGKLVDEQNLPLEYATVALYQLKDKALNRAYSSEWPRNIDSR